MLVIANSRLTLRCWKVADAPEAFRFYGDAEVSRLIGNGQPIPDVEGTERVLQRFIEHQDKFGFCPWAVLENQTNQVIGICGFHTFNESEEMELGFRILKSHWGKRIATEASQLAIQYAFEALHPPHIAALTDVTNRPTQAVLSKLGFTTAGNVTTDRHGRSLIRYELRR